MSMPRRTLGRTGIEVSQLGFGGAPIGLSGYLGGPDRNLPECRAAAIAALRRAVELGVTWFDTAPGYGQGLSEALIGEALAPLRERVLIATKVKFQADAAAPQYDAELRASLARLRTDRVDLLQIHGSQYTAALVAQLEGTGFLDWLETTRRRGLARFVGLSAETPSGALEDLVTSGRFDVLQVAYSIIYQGACDHQREPFGVIPLARRHGLGITVMRAATSGVLQRLFAVAFPEIPTARVTETAIRFALSTSEVDCVLVGMTSAAEVERNVAIATDRARFDLDALHSFYPDRPRGGVASRA